MAKTPYELRMEAIQIAQSQLNQKFYHEWDLAARKAELTEDKTLLTEVPQYPTTEQILAEATKFKKFIDEGHRLSL
jgi:hypothetical protein